MLSDPSVTSPTPSTGHGRAIAAVLVAALGAAAIAFALRPADQAARGPAPTTPPPARTERAPTAAWSLDRCGAAAPAPESPLDAIARAQASLAPARDGVLRGVSVELDVIATWTDRRVWLSVDGGARWGRVLDGPGRVLAVHADRCGRVVVVRDGALGTRLVPGLDDERWRALPAAVAGAFLGLDVRGATVTIAARAPAPRGVDPDDAPASVVSTADRGATWSPVTALGDVADARPVAGAIVVTPRGCPGPAPCREIVRGARRDRYPFALTLIDEPGYAKPWMLAPASACGAALACFAFEGDALAPVEITIDPPAIARIDAVPGGFVAIPRADDQDVIAIGPGYTRTLIGSAGFPAGAFDELDRAYGLAGASLVRLDRHDGVSTLFEVPGTIAPPLAAAPAVAMAGACPAATAIRRASRHNQAWLIPLAVIGNDALADAGGAVESHADEIVTTLDADRARAAGAPALPKDVWLLGRGDAPACHGVVRGYYGAGDDLASNSIVGAIVTGCGGDQADVAIVDVAPGACKVAALAPVDATALPPGLAAHADGAYTPDDPRGAHAATYVGYAVRVPDDGRGYAHLMVDGDADGYSSGWQWLAADGAPVARPEIKDDLSEAITALVYDAGGPRYAIVDGDCKTTIASIGEAGALTRRVTRHLERSTCNREGNPPAAWLSPHEGELLQVH